MRHHCSASVTTLQFVMKCCSSCFSFYSASFPSSKSTRVHSSSDIHFEQLLVNASQLLIFSNQKLYPYLFQPHISLCHFKVKCGAAICQTKELLLIKSDWGCLRTAWCSGYSHKQASKEIKNKRHFFLTAACVLDIVQYLWYIWYTQYFGSCLEKMQIKLTPRMMCLSRILIQWTVSGLRLVIMLHSVRHLTLQLVASNVCATSYCRLFFLVLSWHVWSVCEFIPWRNEFDVPACVFSL